MEKNYKVGKKTIFIGSPLQLLELPKEIKDKATAVVVFDSDFLFGFGYGEHLGNLASTLPSSIIYQFSCIKKSPELESFKSKWMKKVTRIDYSPPEE